MVGNFEIPKNYSEIVNEIAQFTNIPKDVIEERVWREALEIGWNVANDCRSFSVTPHHNNKSMEQLYQFGDGFIFETLVYWTRLERQKWTQSAIDRINFYLRERNLKPEDIRILIFGDGTGNDSLCLVKAGFKVDYFDIPGSKTYEFAINRFKFYDILGSHITLITDYQHCFTQEYDVILSFEVLEHLTDPIVAIKDIYTLLKSGGIAIITEAFDGVLDQFPTHLKINQKYAKLAPFIFLNEKLVLTWYSKEPLFKPMEFVKVQTSTLKDLIRLFGDPLVRQPFLAKKLLPYKLLIKRMIRFPLWLLFCPVRKFMT